METLKNIGCVILIVALGLFLASIMLAVGQMQF